MQEAAIDELELVFLPAQRPELYGILVGYCFTHAVSRASGGVPLTPRIVHTLHRYEYICPECDAKAKDASPPDPRRTLADFLPVRNLSNASASKPSRTGMSSRTLADREEQAAKPRAELRNRKNNRSLNRLRGKVWPVQ
jgi:hypothetical protein